MAELGEACCSTELRQTCCEPDQKDMCCGRGGCGGAAGNEGDPSRDARESVRERYAAAARHASDESQATSHACSAYPISLTDRHGRDVFGRALYQRADASGASDRALKASLGCGVPTAVAHLEEGETVLDLGSGAGADVLISASRVGPTGQVIGLDMTDEMLELARANAAQLGTGNVEFRKGYIEDIPLPDASVDVVISNCVINLSADKAKVIGEVARVLRSGGRLAVTDVIADPHMDQRTRDDISSWTGCIAGALTREQYEQILSAADLKDIVIKMSHRVHEHAASAIIRARKP